MKEKVAKRSTNGFAGLFVEEVSDPITPKVEKKESVVKMPTVVKPDSPSLTGWAAIAAYFTVEAERKVSVEVPPPMTATKKTTLSREYEEAMMGIDEEEDRSSGWFDWGEEAMNYIEYIEYIK